MGDDDLLEQMEHAGHAGHEQHTATPIARYIGLTMAMLGVILALASAMVGGARNELIATMVEQTNASLSYSADATKYRVLQAQLQQLHSLMPSDPKAFDALEAQAAKLEADAGKSPSADAIAVMRLETKKILSTVTPTRADVVRFAELVRNYDHQRHAGREWAESYEEAIKAQSLASEHFEWGQLSAEIGIVIASIALLLTNRKAWLLSILLGIVALGLIGWTFSVTRGSLHHAEATIEEHKKAYFSLGTGPAEREADEQLLQDIEAHAR